MHRLAALALVSTLALPAFAADYRIDPAHTTAGFKVRHMMVSWVRGAFTDVTGTVSYDPDDLASTTATVTIRVASVDTRNADRDAHLRGPDFFDAANHPTMTFRSTRVANVDGRAFDLVGNLTIRGVTREVVLHVDGLSDERLDPWGNLRRGAHATAVVNRQDFGVSWNDTLDAGGVLVGDEVTLDLDVELIREAPSPTR